MKNTNTNKKATKSIADMHTNRLLISVTAALSLLVTILFIHNAQSRMHMWVECADILMGLSVACAVVALVMIVFTAVSKKLYLIEYIALAAVMAFCFYGMHGVPFVNARLMKYATTAILVAYLVLTFVYHTVAPKLIKK